MSKDVINKKLVEHLAELARIELEGDEKKLTGDLKKIVGYFEELSDLKTENVKPVSGGTDLENVMRDDNYDDKNKLSGDRAIKSFPENKDGYLKVPPVFD